MTGLDGAVVVVTGAGRGIGRAHARTLAAHGARVIVNDVAGAPECVERLKADGLTAWADASDISSWEGARSLITEAVSRFGRLDGLVNNAAVVRHKPIGEWDTDGFDEHVATNIRAPFFLIQAALPALRESPIRSVVNVSSSSGILRRVGQSVYGMTKSALDYLTQTLAGELAPLGVRVNGIAPGPIDTPIHATWADDLEEAYRWLSGQVPLGRIGAPEEVALWITLLLSPAAAFMTGAVIPLDGGQVIDRE